MDDDTWNRKLADLRDLFRHDSKELAGMRCVIVHIHDQEVPWSNWTPRVAVPPEVVTYSTSPRSIRRHYYERFATDGGDDAQATLDALQRFNLHAGVAGKWLWNQKPPESDYPLGVNFEHHWLWSLADYGLTCPANDARAIEKQYWLESADQKKPGWATPFPETQEDLDSFRDTLSRYPARSHLIEVVPTVLPKSFFCHIPDVFLASVDFIDRLAGGHAIASGGKANRGAKTNAIKTGVSRPQLAQAAVIAHFSAHPGSDPSAEEIGKPVGLDAATIRNAPAWKLHQRGKKRTADDVGDGAEIGDVDKQLEEITGKQERGRDRRSLRRNE